MGFDVSGILLLVLLIVGRGEVITTEDQSLSSLATSQFVDNHTEFDVSGIF